MESHRLMATILLQITANTTIRAMETASMVPVLKGSKRSPASSLPWKLTRRKNQSYPPKTREGSHRNEAVAALFLIADIARIIPSELFTERGDRVTPSLALYMIITCDGLRTKWMGEHQTASLCFRTCQTALKNSTSLDIRGI